MAKKFTAQDSISQLKLDISIQHRSVKKLDPEAKGRELTLFRSQLSAQLVLLPPDLKSLLPSGHLVFFLINTINELDLSGILLKYKNKGGFGRPAYAPAMLLTLVIYCYSEGITSTRAIERMCHESVPCRILTGNQTPDHDTIANFLKMHREQFDDIFQQVLVLADQAGLVKLDHVAVDGSKIHASASKHKAMSYERMCQKLETLPQKIEKANEEIAELDMANNPKAASDAKELKQDIKFWRKRLAKIKKSKKALERRAKHRAKVEAKTKIRKGCKIQKNSNPKNLLPKPKEQINFTDPDSRIMGHTGGEFEQCFNVQIAVDSQHQIIVAHDVVQHGNDKRSLEPMFLQVHQRLDRYPNAGSADAGYFTEEMINSESLSNIELFVPPDRETHPRSSLPGVGRIPNNISTANRMRRKLSTKRGKDLYAQRKCIVEPVFGQVKESVLGFDQFSWRGLRNVQNQWALVCASHNLLKIYRATSRLNDLSQVQQEIAA